MKEFMVGAKLLDYNSYIVFSHFKVHAMAGYDAAAVDQTALDMVKVADGNESLMARIAQQQCIHTTEYAS